MRERKRKRELARESQREREMTTISGNDMAALLNALDVVS